MHKKGDYDTKHVQTWKRRKKRNLNLSVVVHYYHKRYFSQVRYQIRHKGFFAKHPTTNTGKAANCFTLQKHRDCGKQTILWMIFRGTIITHKEQQVLEWLQLRSNDAHFQLNLKSTAPVFFSGAPPPQWSWHFPRQRRAFYNRAVVGACFLLRRSASTMFLTLDSATVRMNWELATLSGTESTITLQVLNRVRKQFLKKRRK